MKRNSGWVQNMIMVLAGLVVMTVFSASGPCDCSSGSNSTTTEVTGKITATPDPMSADMDTINEKDSYGSGEKVEVLLKGTWNNDDSATFIWHPPLDSTNHVFPAGFTPEPGGPPYRFKNITREQAEAGFKVSYSTPNYDVIGEDYADFEENLEINQKIGGEDYSRYMTMGHTWERKGSSGSTFPVKPDNEFNISLPDAAPVTKWNIIRSSVVEVPMTKTTCQETVALAQSGNTFITIRIPLANEIKTNTAYAIPVIFSGSVYPKTRLISGPLDFDMPMEIRHDATTWSNMNLEAAEGEMWVALGVRPDVDLSTACDYASSQPSVNYLTQIQLDLSNRPASCENCEVLSYFCYETANSSSLADQIKPDVRRLAYGDYTCLGPGETPLASAGNWWLEDYTFSQNLKPGDAIHLDYWITNSDTASAHTFNIASTSSTLNVTDWVIHPGKVGDLFTPDTTRTVTSPFSVPASSDYHLHIMGTVPASAAVGNYTYRMTVTGDGMTPVQKTGSSLLIVTADGSLPAPSTPRPEVKVTGRADTNVISAGQQITYTFTIQNNGDEKLTNLVLKDTLPANTSYVSCTNADSCSLNGNEVTWTLASLGVNNSHSATLVVKVNAGVANGAVIRNDTYSVSTAENVSANGGIVSVIVGPPFRMYAPLFLR